MRISACSEIRPGYSELITSRVDVMYHAIVKRIARKNFLRVNNQNFDALLADCAPDIRHRFGGNHALGGERNDRKALRLWFARLGRLFGGLTLVVEDMWVKGGPWDTTMILRWRSSDTLPDGTPYSNRGVHIVRMRWGKAVSIDAHEDSQAVAAALDRMASLGIAEAVAPPITSA